MLFGRVWLTYDKSKTAQVWKDDERLTKDNYVFKTEEESEEIICSENTTEMDGDDDLFVDWTLIDNYEGMLWFFSLSILEGFDY